MILTCTTDNSNDTFTGNWPANFNQLYDDTIANPDGQYVGVAWKRLTGADSGSYTLSAWGNSTDWVCQAYAFSGRDGTNNPVATHNINTSSNTSPMTAIGIGVTAVSGDDLLWAVAPDTDASGTYIGSTAPTSPVNFTKRQDSVQGWSALAGATYDNMSAGSTGNISGKFTISSGHSGWDTFLVRIPAASGSVTVGGSATTGIWETDIVSGGKTVTLTVTGDTWVAAGTAFDNQRQNIINGMTSAQSETHGWNNEVKAKIPVTDVVRTSNTVVTITLDAEAAYDITANETITVTVPGTAFTGGSPIVGSPTFTINAQVAPTVTTQAVTQILQSSATGNGNVTADGGATITERGICWNTTGTPTTSDSKATASGTTGAFTATITSIAKGSTYHVRAYAINSIGTSYGSEVTFSVPSLVYYSVGQNATNHSSGGNVSIASGLATFTVGQTAPNLGVGDRLTAGTGVYYLASKVDTTHWNVVNKLGNTPSDLSSTSVSSIAHEYTTLAAAIAGASDASHIGNASLVAANVVLNIPCYYDSDVDSTPVTVSGYTTGESNYIEIYTPDTTAANTSQRPNGTWGSHYTIEYNADYRASIFIVSANYVRLDGLQLGATAGATFGAPTGAVEFSGGSGSSEYQVSNCVISAHLMTGAGGVFSHSGIYDANPGTIKIWNNIICDFSFSSTYYGVYLNNASDTAYLYNNTVYNCYTGYALASGTAVAKNDISQDTTSGYSGSFDSTSTNNLSDHTDAPAYNTYYNSKTVSFVSTSGKDFHLSASDTAAKDAGADLSADTYLLFSTDIDGQSRPYGSAWDIGADEYWPNFRDTVKIEGTVKTRGTVIYR